VASLGILLFCAPIGLVATILLCPLWRWIETTYLIESIGHSGPAIWTYLLVYSVLTSIVILMYFLLSAKWRRDTKTE
jgi:uncharacterized BrkB/YihY/UPF0761 family membrane protein